MKPTLLALALALALAACGSEPLERLPDPGEPNIDATGAPGWLWTLTEAAAARFEPGTFVVGEAGHIRVSPTQLTNAPFVLFNGEDGNPPHIFVAPRAEPCDLARILARAEALDLPTSCAR